MREFCEVVKEWAGDMLIFAYGAFFTWVFIYVKVYGSMRIHEDNPIILWVEIIACPLLALLGLERLISDIKRSMRKEDK